MQTLSRILKKLLGLVTEVGGEFIRKEPSILTDLMSFGVLIALVSS